MSATELLELVADDDGQLDLQKGVEALEQAVERLINDGVNLRGNVALHLFSKQIDHMTGLFSETIVGMQAAIVNLQQGMQLLLTGQQPTIADFEAQDELEALLLGFELERLAALYNALLIEKEGAAVADDQTEAGDDQREDDRATQGGAREVPAETLAEGEDADSQE